MTEQELSNEIRELPSPSTMEEFLRLTPPGKVQNIPVLFYTGQYKATILLTPDVLLYCDNERCQGERYFTNTGSQLHATGKEGECGYLHYTCRNCGVARKLFSVMFSWNGSDLSGQIYKFGEFPPFGPHTPSRVVKLIGPDKELFLSGRRCESQGLGIGAYTYYRRVVENQWVRIVDNVIKVAARLDVSPSVIQGLELVKTENQFSKAIEENRELLTIV